MPLAVALLLRSCLRADAGSTAAQQCLQQLDSFASQPYAASLLCLILQHGLLLPAFTSPAWPHVQAELRHSMHVVRRRPDESTHASGQVPCSEVLSALQLVIWYRCMAVACMSAAQWVDHILPSVAAIVWK